jgi:Tol biopolymer transport system component
MTIVLCVGVGFAGLFFSGVLSGPHGDSDDSPAWSPDGNRIAFRSNRDGNLDIYTMNTDGSQVVQLTRDPFADLYFFRSPIDTTPVWSPDGKRIAFASGRENEMMSYVNFNMYMMNVDGSHVVPLTHSDRVDILPAWSPDGQKIAFSGKEMFINNSFIQNPDWDIYVMKADGSGEIPLINDSGNDIEPAWSPDGRQIAFASDCDGNLNFYVINADGSDPVQLTYNSADNRAPVWSPDGKRIAFVSDRNGKQAMYVMNADGSDIVQLTNDQSNASTPSWSPDGSRIAFASDRDGDDDIYVMNADGSGMVQLTGK